MKDNKIRDILAVNCEVTEATYITSFQRLVMRFIGVNPEVRYDYKWTLKMGDDSLHIGDRYLSNNGHDMIITNKVDSVNFIYIGKNTLTETQPKPKNPKQLAFFGSYYIENKS